MKTRHQAISIFAASAAVLLTLFSCTSEMDQLRQTEAEVLAIHDSVMIRTASIYPLKKQLRLKLQSGMDSSLVFDAIQSLDEADEAMNIWMSEFIGVKEELTLEENKNNLRNQLDAINSVRIMTDSALIRAKTLIENE